VPASIGYFPICVCFSLVRPFTTHPYANILVILIFFANWHCVSEFSSSYFVGTLCPEYSFRPTLPTLGEMIWKRMKPCSGVWKEGPLKIHPAFLIIYSFFLYSCIIIILFLKSFHWQTVLSELSFSPIRTYTLKSARAAYTSLPSISNISVWDTTWHTRCINYYRRRLNGYFT